MHNDYTMHNEEYIMHNYMSNYMVINVSLSPLCLTVN